MPAEWLVSLAVMIGVIVVIAIGCWIPLGRWFLGPLERATAALLAAVVVFLIPYFILRLAGGVVVVERERLEVEVVVPPTAALTVVYRWVLGTDRGITSALMEPTPER